MQFIPPKEFRFVDERPGVCLILLCRRTQLLSAVSDQICSDFVSTKLRHKHTLYSVYTYMLYIHTNTRVIRL